MIEQINSISFSNVGKKFCRNLKRSLYYGFLDVSRTFAGVPPDTARLRKDEFWALSDLTLDVQRGDSLGIIGANGSGKSTMLRLVSGVYTPDRGRVVVNGKVGSLITLGAGFHPHFTGSENIYFNGTLLGLTRSEVRERFDDIVAFADIGDFIDSPVSTYSTGMRMRLGFAIAIHTRPDILLVDEILAVGDVNFIKNSYDRIEGMVAENGVTAVVVSHNIGMIQRLCRTTLVLDRGRMVFYGDTMQAVSRYYQLSLQRKIESAAGGASDKFIHHHDCPMQVFIEDFTLSADSAAGTGGVATPCKLGFEISVCNTLNRPVVLPAVSILILDPGMVELYASIQSHGNDCQEALIPERGSMRVLCEAPYMNLAPGEYRIIVKLGGAREGIFHDSVLLTEPLKVSWSAEFLEKVSSVHRDCKLFLDSRWTVAD